MRLGIDIGGTFTDLVAVDEKAERLILFKCLTTPGDLSRCFFEAVDFARKQCRSQGISIVHGTTIATNALLQRHGQGEGAASDDVVGMITTAGFRDVLEIGRHFRRRLYDLFLQKPPVLIPRDLRLEIIERKDCEGRTLVPLEAARVREAASVLRKQGVRSVAVCFINAYADGAHERKARAILLAECPELYVSLSSEVCPEYREFERFSTTAVNAVVMPVVHDYLRRLDEQCAARSLDARVTIMQSNGGMISPEEARRFPVRMIESGPAAGVLAAQYLGSLCGEKDLIAFDMGGTTAKVGLIRNGQIEMKTEYRVGGGAHGDDSDGYPIKTPAIDLVEVSAGGGSVAWVDAGGALRVGPQSSGAKPGPVCYGFGGDQPTITDANLIAGRLRPDYFLGGRLPLDVEAARGAMMEKIASPLGTCVEEAAVGILEIANAQMIRALKLVTVERGYEPRDFTLMAFGGAGPLHAAVLADEMNIRKVLVPFIAGVTSALGLLAADYRHDFSRSFKSRTDHVDLEALTAAFRELEQKGRQTLAGAGVPSQDVELRRSLDMRYVGQAYEVNVPVPKGQLTASRLKNVVRNFHREHHRLYAHSHPAESTEVVLARLAVVGKVTKPKYEVGSPGFAREFLARQETVHREKFERRSQRIFFKPGGSIEAPVIDWRTWLAGEEHKGPALVVREDSTLLVPPGWRAQRDQWGNGVLTR